MTGEAPHASGVDQRGLAASLTPLLADVCDDRLGVISWFRADWQRGGAATGTSTYRDDEGIEHPVVIKLPVVQRELMWLQRLQSEHDTDPVVPRLFASDDVIGGYDLAWVVMERFKHGPLGLRWHDDHIPRIAESVARFQAAAAQYPVNQPPRIEDWDQMIADGLETIRLNPIAESDRWIAAIKKLKQKLDLLVSEWRSRDVKQWAHGDMHLANAMSRHGMNAGAVSLIDLAEVHAGNWIEDAVYLERQLWARPQRLESHNPVRAIAAARRALDLPVEEDYPRLAMLRRVLLAATAPRFIKSEGHPKHLEACLNWLERGLTELT